MASSEHAFRYQGVEFPVLIDDSETIISSTIDQTGVWEDNQLCLYKSLVMDGETFVDIGANVGVNSIFMSRIVPSARVISVEASADNFDLLRKNIAGSPIEAHCLAIADLDGTIMFSGSGTNAKIDGSSSGAGSVSVPARRLDTLMRELNVTDISLLKIDVEGYTDFVLSGAEEMLRKTKQVIVEFSIMDVQARFHCDTPMVTLRFAELLNTLSRHFNHLYYISRKDGLVRISTAIDLIDLLKMEHLVGDILATRQTIPEAIDPTNLLSRIVAQLLPENHNRIVENQRLHERVSELEQTLADLLAAGTDDRKRHSRFLPKWPRTSN